jgi:hypothetical protein
VEDVMSNSHEHQPDTKIELIEYLAKVTKPRVSCCAAKIINYVQNVQEWQDSQTIDCDDYDNEYFYEDYDDGWVRRTYTQIREGLKREHSLHVIREAMELLIRLGFLERRKNLMAENRRNGQIRTYQYRVCTDRIKAVLETM